MRKGRRKGKKCVFKGVHIFGNYILSFPERDDIWVLGRAESFQVFVDGNLASCESRQDIGSAVFCDTPGKQYHYVIRTNLFTNDFGTYLNFRYNFAVTRFTDSFTVTVKLPLGSALVESERLTGTGLRPFEPVFGQQGTDGRRILVSWSLIEPKLGETLPVSIVYEGVLPISSEQLPFVILGVVIVLGGVGFFLWRRHAMIKTSPPTWKLNREERNVLQIIASHGKIEQAELVRDIGFNKVKVSRIVNRLKDLGFIKSAKIGRKHLLTITDRAVEADWLVHLNELKGNVLDPWLAGLDEWRGEGEKPPISLAFNPKIKKPLFNDLRNHFPALTSEWKRLWRDYTKYSRAWGRARQALQAVLVRHGKVVNAEEASDILKDIGNGKPPADIKISREIKKGAKGLVSTEKKLQRKIEKFRETLEKMQHYTRLPGTCEYIE